MFRTATLLAVTLLLTTQLMTNTEGLNAAEKASKRIKPQVFLEYNKLPAGGKCRVIMEVQVEKGWHINANPAEPDLLIPTTFSIKSAQGIKLTDVKYPKHHVISIEGVGKANVYDGKIRISGILNVPSSAAGSVDELQLVVNYQACDDRSCERPDVATIKGKIPVVASASELKKTNPEYFD
ncbi:disulfide bond corrector protein DsbC [Polystyrenella longa]|uniref:Disulfide bond corrector protein DsbC n=1 Tax=Polystyrenella longa TaxID=2528007 RepID=A0A518CMA1_9PLAN|nr:protein-disulfide reductase DsbD domain-containing protein [Polystyrenella longa]QDU80360.1 disulfide bond corrector protein DsbC [Polystyrenella longa]